MLPSKAPLYFALCLLGVAVLYFVTGTLGQNDSGLTRTADELQHTQSLLDAVRLAFAYVLWVCVRAMLCMCASGERPQILSHGSKKNK